MELKWVPHRSVGYDTYHHGKTWWGLIVTKCGLLSSTQDLPNAFDSSLVVFRPINTQENTFQKSLIRCTLILMMKWYLSGGWLAFSVLYSVEDCWILELPHCGVGQRLHLIESKSLLVTEVSLAPLSMGFSRQEEWSGLSFPSQGDLPDPGIEPLAPASPALQAYSLLLSHQRSPLIQIICC